MIKQFGYGIYHIGLPFIRKALRGSRRVRVVITVDDEILLVKNIVSRQKWMLPGGGIKESEAPRLAAVRELQEELNLKVDQQRLKFLSEFDFMDDHNVSWRAVILHLPLEEKPKIRRKRSELLAAQWVNRESLPQPRNHLVDKAISYLN